MRAKQLPPFFWSTPSGNPIKRPPLSEREKGPPGLFDFWDLNQPTLFGVLGKESKGTPGLLPKPDLKQACAGLHNAWLQIITCEGWPFQDPNARSIVCHIKYVQVIAIFPTWRLPMVDV